MIVYDIEIEKAIPNKKEEPVEGIEYCKGWGDFSGMGVSIVTVYDYKDERYRIFCKDNQEEFKALVAARSTFAGYNNIKFDNRVLEACWGIEIDPDCCFDILDKIRKKVGFFKAAGLNEYVAKNCGVTKTDSGAMAPLYWQRGEYGKLFDYGLNDSYMTKRLLDKIIKDGFLINPKNDAIVEIPRDGIRPEYI